MIALQQDDKTADRLVTLITDMNIRVLDRLLEKCRVKTNFICASNAACDLKKKVLNHLKEIETCLPR